MACKRTSILWNLRLAKATEIVTSTSFERIEKDSFVYYFGTFPAGFVGTIAIGTRGDLHRRAWWFDDVYGEF